MAMGSFNERVAVAFDLVRSRFPGAQLHGAQGWCSSGPTSTPMAIDRLKVLFRNDDGTVLMVEETSYREFGPMRRLDPPPPVGGAIDWPIEMDLPEADNRKEEAAYIDPYVTVTLRAGVNGTPEFVFGGNPQCAAVIVDTVSGFAREG